MKRVAAEANLFSAQNMNTVDAAIEQSSSNKKLLIAHRLHDDVINGNVQSNARRNGASGNGATHIFFFKIRNSFFGL